MSRKGKRRRDESRRRHTAGAPGPTKPEVAGEQPAEHPARPARPTRARDRSSGRPRVSGRQIQTLAWTAGGLGVIGAIAVFVFLIVTSGSSSSGAPEPSATEDPRVAGLEVDASFNVEARGAESGSTYVPDTITAKAGDVIELVVTNNGTVSHNMRVSGPNKVFDVDTSGDKGDDFEMPPRVIEPGKTERLKVKIDQPGSYPFRCDFHPIDQKGTLILQ
ncbi:MAG: cupredoxin domain-containing protein [Dehalococcoidia bacterium]|nr:cupredoxin domain-containing protein [Dehalococcoidia bacterium]